MERVKSFKFLGVHITDNLKGSIHTDSVVKKEQHRLFNLRRLKKCSLAPKTLTNFYRPLIATCWAVSLPGTATSTTAGLSRGLCGQPNTSPGAYCLPSRTSTAPDVTGRPRRSLRTSATRATACSPRYHSEDEVSTGASKLGPSD